MRFYFLNFLAVFLCRFTFRRCLGVLGRFGTTRSYYLILDHINDLVVFRRVLLRNLLGFLRRFLGFLDGPIFFLFRGFLGFLFLRLDWLRDDIFPSCRLYQDLNRQLSFRRYVAFVRAVVLRSDLFGDHGGLGDHDLRGVHGGGLLFFQLHDANAVPVLRAVRFAGSAFLAILARRRRRRGRGGRGRGAVRNVSRKFYNRFRLVGGGHPLRAISDNFTYFSFCTWTIQLYKVIVTLSESRNY